MGARVTNVVTGIWGDAWERYGETFVKTFSKYWPQSVPLTVYTDRNDIRPERAEIRMLSDIPGFAEWRERYRDDPFANGREPRPQHAWKPKELDKRQSWRHDAFKWMPQGVIPYHAMIALPDGEIFCWLDADVVTHRKVPEGFVDALLGRCECAYLGREPKHSEIGFWAARATPNGRRLAQIMANCYLSDRWMTLPQNHSAYCFDVARRESEIVARNLTPGRTGHVWFDCALGDYMDHEKGKRKGRGSPQAAAKGWRRHV